MGAVLSMCGIFIPTYQVKPIDNIIINNCSTFTSYNLHNSGRTINLLLKNDNNINNLLEQIDELLKIYIDMNRCLNDDVILVKRIVKSITSIDKYKQIILHNEKKEKLFVISFGNNNQILDLCINIDLLESKLAYEKIPQHNKWFQFFL